MGLALEEPVDSPDDEKLSVNGITLVYESSLSRFLYGKVIDYVSGFLGSKFKVYDAQTGASSDSC